MAKPLVSDELWARIEPLLPPEKPRHFRFPGRRPIDRRKVLTGIVFVLETGIAWDDRPAELGWGCGRTCREALAAWQRAGIWDRLHEVLLDELGDRGLIDWSRALIDSATSKAPKGGELTGPSPTDRRKKGSKHHVITDAGGVPLAIELTGANRHDTTQMLPLVDATAPIRGPWGRPRRRPDRAPGDRAYDSKKNRKGLWKRGIRSALTKRGTAHGSGLGETRWYVERTLAWLHQDGRLRVRWDRLPEVQRGWMSLACALICLRLLL
jgi:transposase